MPQIKSKLLIVDDSSLYRELLSRRLLQEGYDVHCAADGAEGLYKIESEAFDMVLLDIMMPKPDGFEVLREVRRTHPMDTLPVIMVTANDDSQRMVKALGLGANDYFPKTLDPLVALARIAAHLAIKRLVAANRDFLGIASHDLKKPLAVILDVLETLRDEYPAGAAVDHELHDMLGIALQTVRQMQQIIQDFLDLGASESGHLKLEPAPVDLNALVRQVVNNNAVHARHKEHNLTLKLDSALPLIQGDAARLAQVIDNLLGNAIKFSPRQARTIVHTRCEGSTVLCAVQDTGPGLSSDDLQKVFNTKFAKLSNAPTDGEMSTGLGLNICKQLIDLHNGQIGVYNNPHGPGAIFWFRLPVRGQ